MADKGGSGSRKSEGKHPNKNQGRDRKESRNGSQHKPAQTDTLNVHRVGVQLHPPLSWDEDITDTNMSVQSPSSRDVEQTNRKTSDQLVQSLEESSGGQDNQLTPATASSSNNFVNNKGPVQLGTGNTVVKPTYKDCNINHHHHHHHHHHHLPDQFDRSNFNDYMRFAEERAVAIMPADPSNTGTPSPDPPLPAGANQIEWRQNPSNVDQITHSHNDHPTDSSEQGLSPLYATASRLPESQQAEKTPSHSSSQPSDEVTKSTRDERKPERRSVENQSIFANILSIFGFRSNAQTRPVPDDVIRDTVRIIDSKGRVLEPGDVVLAGSSPAVYIGGQRIVRLVGRKPNLMVKEEALDLTSPFRKERVVRGQCPMFPPGKRVERAKEKIGSLFNEGDEENGWDFVWWVFTGMGVIQAMDKGFDVWFY